VVAFLDGERIIAEPGYNRWLVLSAALAIHLTIGEVYLLALGAMPLAWEVLKQFGRP
jgi:hypothetical protein